MSVNFLIGLSIAVTAVTILPLHAAETAATCAARNMVPGGCKPYIFDVKTRFCLPGLCIEVPDVADSEIPRTGGTSGGVSYTINLEKNDTTPVASSKSPAMNPGFKNLEKIPELSRTAPDSK